MTKGTQIDSTGTFVLTSGWSEGSVTGTLLKNQYYLISFYIDVPGSTFKNRDNGTVVPTKPYMFFLKGKNVTSGGIINPGTYDIRLTVTPL